MWSPLDLEETEPRKSLGVCRKPRELPGRGHVCEAAFPNKRVRVEPGNALGHAPASESPSAGERWGRGPIHNSAAPSQPPVRTPRDSICSHLQRLCSN